MQVFNTVNEIQNYLNQKNFDSVGFVPTMGALHTAHISLIEKSKDENELTICSIFVNPKQFNKKEDLLKYPRNLDLDIEKLKVTQCDVLFVPSVEEMYPSDADKEFDFGMLSKVMEAEHRPGHFNGVATVIDRFFNILKPSRAYFGEKDYQQLAVIKALVKQLNSSVEIIGCPIYREKNGLAMSSRNEHLSQDEKEEASNICRTLQYVSKHKKTHTVKELKSYFSTQINQHSLFETEYFEIANADTLEPVSNWEDAENFIAFTAINVNGVRLIDNMTIIN